MDLFQCKKYTTSQTKLEFCIEKQDILKTQQTEQGVCKKNKAPAQSTITNYQQLSNTAPLLTKLQWNQYHSNPAVVAWSVKAFSNNTDHLQAVDRIPAWDDVYIR